MCVDRLEAGLKPACAAACLAGALDFGMIETVPENREQLEARIPGFPDARHHPSQHPLPADEVVAARADPPGQHAHPLCARPDRAQAATTGRPWMRTAARAVGASKKLRTREDPLVVFTLVSQAVVGAFMLLFLAPWLGVELLSPQQHPLCHSSLSVRPDWRRDRGAGAVHPASRPAAPLLSRLQQPALLAGVARSRGHRRVLQSARRLRAAQLRFPLLRSPGDARGWHVLDCQWL